MIYGNTKAGCLPDKKFNYTGLSIRNEIISAGW